MPNATRTPRYRVDDLAARAGVSVDTVRFYQTKGLLPAPGREGRLAWYGEEHLARLARIRDLKDKGFTLTSIRRLLTGNLDAADEALVEAVAGAAPGEESDGTLTREQLAARIGVPEELVRAIERERLLIPPMREGRPVYTESDVEAARAGLALLEHGIPLDALLDLARRHDRAMREVADRAVELFDAHIRASVRASSSSEAEAAGKLVDAFRSMLPATTTLVAHHFRRVLLAAAQAKIEDAAAEPAP